MGYQKRLPLTRGGWTSMERNRAPSCMEEDWEAVYWLSSNRACGDCQSQRERYSYNFFLLTVHCINRTVFRGVSIWDYNTEFPFAGGGAYAASSGTILRVHPNTLINWNNDNIRPPLIPVGKHRASHGWFQAYLPSRETMPQNNMFSEWKIYPGTLRNFRCNSRLELRFWLRAVRRMASSISCALPPASKRLRRINAFWHVFMSSGHCCEFCLVTYSRIGTCASRSQLYAGFNAYMLDIGSHQIVRCILVCYSC